DRIAAHPRLGRDHLLPRDFDALALRVEQQAVVHAAQIGALAAAERERSEAVDAAVLEGDDAAGLRRPVKHDGFAEDGHRTGLAVFDLMLPGRHIPGILDVGHASLRLDPRRSPPRLIAGDGPFLNLTE